MIYLEANYRSQSSAGYGAGAHWQMEAVFNHLRNKGSLATECDHFMSCPAEGSARVLARLSFGCEEGRVAHAKGKVLIRLEGWAQNACPQARSSNENYIHQDKFTNSQKSSTAVPGNMLAKHHCCSKQGPSMPGLPQP